MLCFLLWLIVLASVTVTDKSTHSSLQLTMGSEIGVVETELPDLGELAFDAIEPGSIGRRPDQANIVISCPTSYFRAFVRGEVVQNKIDPFSPGVVFP